MKSYVGHTGIFKTRCTCRCFVSNLFRFLYFIFFSGKSSRWKCAVALASNFMNNSSETSFTAEKQVVLQNFSCQRRTLNEDRPESVRRDTTHTLRINSLKMGRESFKKNKENHASRRLLTRDWLNSECL